MLILIDNDVVGAVAVLRRVIRGGEWLEYAEILGVRFVRLDDLGLSRDAKDLEVWRMAQRSGAILITGDRAGGEDSLDRAIEAHSGPESLPVLTISDPRRVSRDPDYAVAAVVRLFKYLDEIESLRGGGRRYNP